MFKKTIDFIRDIYCTKEFIPLHEPMFFGNEKKYLNECIDSTFVSSVGEFVNIVEEKLANFIGVDHVVVMMNGTSALHLALRVAGVCDGEVITQPLTFIATCNAIEYCGAKPIFVDVDRESMGMSPGALRIFLAKNCRLESGVCINNSTGNIIRACVPMHTFGMPCKIDEIATICSEYNIALIEDAAESLGSLYKGRHTGTYGVAGVFSFNGNKIITSGGGGCIITNDAEFAKRAKHMSTTAKVAHKWKYEHDSVGFNYRMPNLNAALLLAQLEKIDVFLKNKRELAKKYENFFALEGVEFFMEYDGGESNYWLNAIILPNKLERDMFLEETNLNGIMTRPAWTLMNRMKIFHASQCGDLMNSLWLEERIVNLPSSVTLRA